MRWTRTLTALALAGALAGCASRAPESALAEGPRMIDLYRGAATAPAQPGPESSAKAGAQAARCRWWLFAWPCERAEGDREPEAAAEEPSYARTAANELELLFPRLPNPDIYIHVLPHLATGERVPVPGYTTAVPLYERVEYAMPGERERALRLLEPAPDAESADADGRSSGAASEDGKAP